MNEKAIFEIGNIIHIRYKGSLNPIKWFKGDKLTAKEITEDWNYISFKEHYPELCRLAEEEIKE